MEFNPIELTGIFFFGSLVLAVVYLSTSGFVRSAFKRYWKIIVILVLANIALKVPYRSEFFDGLEYEDSYIYKASARAIFEGKYEYSRINPHYPTSCVYGSLRDCRMSAIFVTNFLGYPYLINLGYLLFGYQLNIANIISLLFSGLSIAFLFLVAFFIIDQLLFALVCCFVYITIPIFNVYASSSLTEPLSNAYLILVLLLFLTFMSPDKEAKSTQLQNILGLSAIAFSLIFSILIKTSNLSLIVCLPIAGLISLMNGKKIKDRNQRNIFLISLPVIFLVLIFSILVLKFQTAIEINRGDIGANPFLLSYFKSLAPVFVKCLFDFQWYLFYTLFFLVGIVFGLKKWIGIWPITVFVFYFLLYTFHYRSYYFTRGLPVIKDEALRYMTSTVSVYSLIVGLGVYYLWRLIKNAAANKWSTLVGKTIMALLLTVILGISTLLSLKWRAYFVEDEQNVRVAPVLTTLVHLGSQDDWLITSEPILFQIYGDVDLRLIDFCSIDILMPKEEVDSLIKSSSVYYLETIARDRLDEERYRLQLQYLDSKRKELIYSGMDYRIFRLLQE